MPRVGAQGASEVPPASLVEDAEHDVARGCQDARGRAAAYGAGVFAQRDIAHVVDGILNAPVGAHQGQYVAGRPVRLQTGDKVAHLAGLDAVLGGDAFDAQHLVDLGPAHFRQRGGEDRRRPERALRVAADVANMSVGGREDLAGGGWSKSSATSAASPGWFALTANRKWPRVKLTRFGGHL